MHLAKSQHRTLQGIQKFLDHPLTARELAKHLRLPSRDFVRLRIDELIKMGLITRAGKRRCTVSGHHATTYIPLVFVLTEVNR